MPVETRHLTLFAPDTFPEIKPQDPLPQILARSFANAEGGLQGGDILVLAQKIVSKSEGRQIELSSICPSSKALDLARETGKDARLVELILRESTEIVRKRPGLIIARHRNGYVTANAAIDLSNAGARNTAVLLPSDPDASAKSITEGLKKITGLFIAIIIIDSMGRAWRNGTIGTAIGCYGIPALLNCRGQFDRDGFELQTSEIAIADEIASAASLLMGQGNEGLPAVMVRGLRWATGEGAAAELVRSREQDLFN